MQRQNDICVRQICFMLVSGCAMGKMIVAPALSAKYADEALWISSLINFLADGAFLLFALWLSEKFDGLTFYEILYGAFGKIFAKIVYFIFFLFFLLKGFIPLVEQKNYIEIALYETAPSVFTFLGFFLFSSFFCYKGIKSVARCADVTVWAAAFGIVTLLALAVPLTDLTELLPVVGVPIGKILHGAKNTFVWYFDGVYILFLIGRFKKEKAYKRKILCSYAVMALITIVYSIILYGEFGAITERQFFSPIQIGKSNVALSNIGRIDYVAGFVFAFVCAFNVATPFVFASHALEVTFDIKNKLIPVFVVNGTMLLSLLVAHDYFIEVFRFLSDKAIWGYFVAAYAIPLICVFAKRSKIREKISKV